MMEQTEAKKKTKAAPVLTADAPTSNKPKIELGQRKAMTEEHKPRIVSYNELLNLDKEEVDFLFDKTIMQGELGLLYGESDSGKSMWLRQMAMHVATGRDFCGWKYRGTHHRALYFSSEDGDVITASVIKKNQKTLNLIQSAGENLQFVFDWEAEELVELIDKLLTEQPRDLICIDAFGDAFLGKNTNDTLEVRTFYKAYSELCKKHKVTIIFNHHIGKSAAQFAPSKHNVLGSEAIVSKVRFAIELRNDPNNTDIKHICLTKGNYLPNEFKRKSTACIMDANLVFVTTGDNVAFEDLAKRSTAPKEKPNADPKSIDNATHRNFLRSIFNGSTLNQSQINHQVRAEFNISDKTARKFLEFYSEMAMIQECEKQGRSILYKCLVK